MKKLKEKLKYGKRGITLITLVVTIIILLILAGVTINLLLSDTGLLSKAQQAKNTWENAEQSDINAIGELANELNEMLNGTGTETTTGNQFVWIPVGTVYKDEEKTETSTIQLGRYTFNDTTGEPTPVQLAYTDENPTNYINRNGTVGVIDTYFSELSISRPGVASTEIGVGENATAKSLEDFVDSVKTNKGYYLARYEASYGSGYNSEGADDAERYANAKPLSKISEANSVDNMKYVTGTLWNAITQINASKVCQNMYENDNTVGVESDLVNSYAWDTAIVFIQEMGNSNYANANSIATGNSDLMNTGETEDTVCNIYDMAGNLVEYTTEQCNYEDTDGIIYSYTARGGSYNSSNINWVADRIYSRGTRSIGITFRPILYII